MSRILKACLPETYVSSLKCLLLDGTDITPHVSCKTRTLIPSDLLFPVLSCDCASSSNTLFKCCQPGFHAFFFSVKVITFALNILLTMYSSK